VKRLNADIQYKEKYIFELTGKLNEKEKELIRQTL